MAGWTKVGGAVSVPVTPRYRRIAADLSAAIEDGRLRIGDELPSEHELCESYGVSRSTVREAVRRLQLRGLVSRQQGAVSRVIATEMPGYTVVLGSPGETREYAENNTVDFCPQTGTPSAQKAAELGLPDPDVFVAASGLRWERGSRLPIGLTTVYIRRPYSEVIESVRGRSPLVLFSPICSSYGLSLTHVDEATTGVAIGPGEARRLGCAAGAPGLRIVHRFYADTVGLFEVSDEIHPADRFTLSHRFDTVPDEEPPSGTG
jgi:GntR family transcriptional regulator